MTKGSITSLFHSSQDPNGKVLNCLDLPKLDDEPRLSKNRLDCSKEVWRGVSGLSYLGAPYPSEKLSWYLAATDGAYSDFHSDCNGTSTRISVLVGGKIWIFAVPIDEALQSGHQLSQPEPPLGFMELFLEGFKGESIDWGRFRLVPIYLRPGYELYVP